MKTTDRPGWSLLLLTLLLTPLLVPGCSATRPRAKAPVAEPGAAVRQGDALHIAYQSNESGAIEPCG